MRDCENYTELAALLADGLLSAEEEASLRGHAASCAACQKRLEEYAAIHDALRGAVKPPDTLVPGVMYKLSLPKERTGLRRFMPRGFALAAACLAILLLAVSRDGGDFFSWRGDILPEAAPDIVDPVTSGTTDGGSPPMTAPSAMTDPAESGGASPSLDQNGSQDLDMGRAPAAEGTGPSGDDGVSLNGGDGMFLNGGDSASPGGGDSASPAGGGPSISAPLPAGETPPPAGGGGSDSSAGGIPPVPGPASTPEPGPDPTSPHATEDSLISWQIPSSPRETHWADIFLPDPSEYALALIAARPPGPEPEGERAERGGLTAHIAEYAGPDKVQAALLAAGGVLLEGTGEKYLVVFVWEP